MNGSLSDSCVSLSQENERTKDLIIEQRFHRAIIGQKGEKIKEVRDKFPEVRSRDRTPITRVTRRRRCVGLRCRWDPRLAERYRALWSVTVHPPGL